VQIENYYDVLRTMRGVMPVFLRTHNVVGSAVGHRWRGGERTDERVIRVFVRRKEPVSTLRRGQRVPKRVPVVPARGGKSGDWVATDVIETGPVRFARDPIRGGDALQSDEGGVGTVGIRFLNHADRRHYVLTCAHVADPAADGPGPASVRVRSGEDVPCHDPRVLDVRRSPLSRDLPKRSLDAAVLRVKHPRSPAKANLCIASVTRPITRLSDPRRRMEGGLSVFSRITGKWLWGYDLDAKGSLIVESRPAVPGAYLTDVFSMRVGVRRGDSGSVVIWHDPCGELHAVGVLAAVAGGRGYFQPIRTILRAFRDGPHKFRVRMNVEGDV
jgi:hypothetical protein